MITSTYKPSEAYSQEDTAKIIGVSVHTLKRLTVSEGLRYFTVKRRIYYPKDLIHNWLASHPEKADWRVRSEAKRKKAPQSGNPLKNKGYVCTCSDCKFLKVISVEDMVKRGDRSRLVCRRCDLSIENNVFNCGCLHFWKKGQKYASMPHPSINDDDD